jgi:hypothetical protein
MCKCLSETCRSGCKGSRNIEDHKGDQSKTVLLKRGRDTLSLLYLFFYSSKCHAWVQGKNQKLQIPTPNKRSIQHNYNKTWTDSSQRQVQLRIWGTIKM